MFLERGILGMRQAGRYLQTLPYGRPSDRAGYLAVLAEGRGTCSTKHALLAALAAEQELPISLTLGLYEMTEANTPGVGAVLERAGLPAILEAHCFLTHAGVRIDVTRLAASPAEPIGQFLHEERIVPNQIGAYKVRLHRAALERWLERHSEACRGMTIDEVWAVREACIAALGQ